MARVRKIQRKPTSGRNYYVVDANFLANRYIPVGLAPVGNQQAQLKANKARLYPGYLYRRDLQSSREEIL